MLESLDEINYDYVTQKLLFLLLIKGCSVVVRPFEYGSRLDGLFEIIRVFYIIEEIDMNKITNPAHLEGFFSQYDDGEKKSILLLRNVSQESMNEVIKYPEILFIALEKDQSIDYSEFQQIAIFNKKTKKLSQLIPKSLISPNSLAYKWIKEEIISRLKSDGIFKVKEYLSSIEDKVGDLFQILPGITKKDYQEFCADITPLEQKAITAICEKYYNVKLPEYTKKTIKIIKKLENMGKDDEIKEIEQINTAVKPKEAEILPPKTIKDPIPIKKIIENTQTHSENLIVENKINEDQINEEIWDLLSDDSAFNAFSLSLSEIEIPIEGTFSTPEKKYFYLRAHQWKTEIPSKFFRTLFQYYVREEIKSAGVPKSKIRQYLMDKHENLVDICSMFASPDFKRMDLSQFENDEFLELHTKKEPIVSHILPVEKVSKSLPPKEIEKIFDREIKPDGNKNFNIQYQKNLELLKKEYGEREINSELVDKLRNRTKELKNKISVLFQE